MTVHKTTSVTHIVIFNIPIYRIKGTLLVTLGEIMAVYKTMSATHITIIEISIHLAIVTIISINQRTQTILLR